MNPAVVPSPLLSPSSHGEPGTLVLSPQHPGSKYAPSSSVNIMEGSGYLSRSKLEFPDYSEHSETRSQHSRQHDMLSAHGSFRSTSASNALRTISAPQRELSLGLSGQSSSQTKRLEASLRSNTISMASVGANRVTDVRIADGHTTVEDDKANKYDMHPILLNFLDPEVEQRYFNFQYVDNMFIPGKVFALFWTVYLLSTFLFYTSPIDDLDYTIETFSSVWWMGSYISTGTCAILTIGLFIDRLRPYREIIHLIQIFVGWPTFALELLILKRPHLYTYNTLIAGMFGVMFIAQCRLRRSLPLLVGWSITCQLVITFSIKEYWETHTKAEMIFWAVLVIPAGLLGCLEKHIRLAFVQKEKSTASIEVIEYKTAVTQRVIANFFPPTPTHDLLQRLDGPRGRSYPGTALIVADIAGFTAYTSRSSPSDVISMLTEMFQAFNTVAATYGVEKIATVGDMYCGAIFAGAVKPRDQCTGIVMFACSTLGLAGYGLDLRVGVHIGDVEGVFVGCAPPKFDLFGSGIDHAQLLEENGHPGYVHVSHMVLQTMGIQASNASDLTVTELGVICRSWSELFGDNHDMVIDAATWHDQRQVPNPPVLDSALIVQVLCAFSSADPVGAVEVAKDGDHHSTTNDEGEGLLEKDEEHTTNFDFNKYFLVFNRACIERRYQQHVAKSGINDLCAQMILLIMLGLLVAQINLQCGTVRNKGIASGILVALTLMGIYIRFIGSDNRFHAVITFVVYNSIAIITILGVESNCTDAVLPAKYISDFALCYYCTSIFATHYCLNLKLTIRTLLNVVSATIFTLCLVCRWLIYDDGVAVLDSSPLQGLVFFILSFFPDYSLRSGFRTELQLDRLRKVAKSRGAAMSTSALSIMLPTFVTERIVAVAKETSARDSSQDTFSDTATVSSHCDSLDIDFNEMTATWEYNHTVVMFAEFKSSDPSFTPDTINMTVQAVEHIMKRFDVMKVKTIRSAIMLVVGIDDPRTRQEQVTAVVDAAVAIRTCVFREMNVPNLTHRIGIHCGPCFGAVIGGNGAIFDLFGDTVNTASRMMTTALPGSIQLSSAATLLLLPRLKEGVTAREPLHVKGKGTMEAFALSTTATNETLTEFLPSNTSETPLERWRKLYGKRGKSQMALSRNLTTFSTNGHQHTER